jgi:hypothetical protein
VGTVGNNVEVGIAVREAVAVEVKGVIVNVGVKLAVDVTVFVRVNVRGERRAQSPCWRWVQVGRVCAWGNRWVSEA